MKSVSSMLVLSFVLAMAGCNSGSGAAPSPPALPFPNNAAPVPAGVTAAAGYRISVFAVMPHTSTNPDSIVQMGDNVFVGVGDDLNPDGTPGPLGMARMIEPGMIQRPPCARRPNVPARATEDPFRPDPQGARQRSHARAHSAQTIEEARDGLVTCLAEIERDGVECGVETMRNEAFGDQWNRELS